MTNNLNKIKPELLKNILEINKTFVNSDSLKSALKKTEKILKKIFVNKKIKIYNSDFLEESDDSNKNVNNIRLLPDKNLYLRISGKEELNQNENLIIENIKENLFHLNENIIETEHLKDSEATFKSLLESSKYWIISLDKSHKPFFYNKSYADAFERFFKRKLNPNIPITTNIPYEMRNIWLEDYKRVFSGEKYTKEMYFEYQNERRCIEVSLNPIIRNNEIIGIAEFIMDITEKKDFTKKLEQTKKELEKKYKEKVKEIENINLLLKREIKKKETSEANLRAVFNSSGQSFLLLDNDLYIKAFNEKAEELIFLITQKHIEINRNILIYVPPNEKENAEKKLKRTLNGEMISVERNIAHSKKTETIYRIVYYPVRKEDSEIVGICITAEDITVTKKSQHILTEKERTLRTLLNAPDYAIALLDKNLRIIDANRETCIRFKKSLPELRDLTIFDILPNAVAQSRNEHFKELFTTKKAQRFTDFRNGFWNDNTIYPIFGESGEINRIAVFAHDITHIKNTEEALRKSQREYAALIDNIPDIIFRYDRNYRHIYVGPAVEKEFGLSSDDLINTKVFDITNDEKLAKKAEETLDYVFTTGKSAAAELTTQYPDGLNTKFYNTLFVPEKNENGNVVSVLAISRDITEIKTAEMQIKSAFSELEQIFQSALALAVVNQDGLIKKANTSFLELFNLSFGETIGESCSDVIPEICENKDFHLHDIIHKGLEKEWEFKFLRGNSSEKIVLVTAFPFYNTERKIIGIILSFTDITEKRRVEEETKIQQQQLIQADKMISLGILVAGVAHEINNPNNLALLNVPILLEAWNNIKPILDKHYKRFGDFKCGENLTYSDIVESFPILLNSIIEGSRRIKSIVNELKNFSRQDQTELFTMIDLTSVVRAALNLMTKLIKDSTDNFNVFYKTDLPFVFGNFQRLEQVIINLVENACQAVKETGFKNRKISVKFEEDKKREEVIVHIIDEGVGMNEQTLKNVLDPFFTTKRANGGTGLGLSVSSKIIYTHKGHLVFNSELGVGTVASVILPIAERFKRESEI